MTDAGIDDSGETLDDDGIDAVILDRMTNTLMILQCKHPTAHRAAMIAALKAVRDRGDEDMRVFVVEGATDERAIRQFLASLNRTSLGAQEIYLVRANASARRVADILGRAIHAATP